ncbi:MAG: hypothetical protein N2508_14660, partial [Anaerolineae bacterium]|nr:hypothetical protein [Anaerolineae bacterium]
MEQRADPEILPPAGGTVTFILEANSAGPSPMTDVDITDTLPQGWRYVTGSTTVIYPDGSRGHPEPTINGRVLSWDLSHQLASYQTLRLEFKARVGGGAPTVNTNTALASGKYRDHIFKASDTASVYISALNLNKIASHATARPGETIVYTLTYENRGGITTTNTYINDPIPVGTTFLSASEGGIYLPASNAVRWTLGHLPPAVSGTLTLTVQVNRGVENGTFIENTGYIYSNQTGTVYGNTVRTTVLAPQLNVSKSGPGNASKGSIITYTIRYENTGGAAATGVVISDTIPVSTTYVAGSLAIDTGSGWVALSDAADGDQGAFIAPTLVITPATVGPGESGAIRFAVRIASGLPHRSTIYNRAMYQHDLINPRYTALVATAIRELTLVKQADKAVAHPGETITYTLIYGNHGAITETNVYIYDSIPEHTSLVSGTVTGAGLVIEYSQNHRLSWSSTYTDPAAVTDIRWFVPALPPGAVNRRASFSVQLDNPLPGGVTIQNVATISSTGRGLGYSNIVNIGTVDLIIYKHASSSYAFPGDRITYTITYGNNGSANAVGVVITDRIPISMTYVPGSITGTGADDSDPSRLVWRIGALPAGARNLQATFVAVLNPAAKKGVTVVNTAVISDGIESETSNQSQVTVASAGLTIYPNYEKWVRAGQTVYYPHTIVNTGNVADMASIAFSNSLWPAAAALYRDLDGDGTLDPGEPAITSTVGPILPGQERDILLKLNVPASANICDVNVTVITVTSTLSPSLSSLVHDISKLPCSTVQFSRPSHSIGEWEGLATISVTLNTPSAFTVTVDYATSDGTARAGFDYAATSGTLIFTPGTTIRTFTVPITDDFEYEGDETIALVLSNPENATIGGTNPATLTVLDNDYVLATHVVGGGSVTRAPHKPTYHYGDVVTLTAVAAPGWSFAGWSGDLTGSASPATLVMTGHRTVTATFTRDEYTLTLHVVGEGSVTRTPHKPTYHYGDVVTLTAVAAPGWSFAGWSGDLSGSENPATLLITGHRAVTATFTQDEYTPTINIVGEGRATRTPHKPTYHY